MTLTVPDRSLTRAEGKDHHEVQVGEDTVMIVYDASVAEYPAFQETAEAILSSLRFGSP